MQKIFEVENFGVLQKFLALRAFLMWCWIFKLVKKTTFFEKDAFLFFFSSGGSRYQKFLPSNFSVHVAENNNSCRNRQQMLVLLSHPFSRNFWMNLSRKKRFLRGALHFVQFWWHDFGNTTQKCSENQFQDSSTFWAFQAHFDDVIFLRSEICRFFSIRDAHLAKKHFFMLYAGKKYRKINLGILPIFWGLRNQWLCSVWFPTAKNVPSG